MTSRNYAIGYPVDASISSILVENAEAMVRVQPVAAAAYWLNRGHQVWDATTMRRLELVETTPGGKKEVCVVVPPAAGWKGWRPFDLEEYKRFYAETLANIDWAIAQINASARRRFGLTAVQIAVSGLEKKDDVRRPRSATI